MDQVQEAHIDVTQHDLLSRLKELFPLGWETLLYDTTNYFTFIDTFNERIQLAQRGHNKQKRHDLRQFSLALFEDKQTGLPLYHQCDAGNRPDVSHFTTAWQGMVVAGFAKKLLMLLTTSPVTRLRKSLWQVVESYLARWRVEETIRFIKQSYQLEDIRLLTYERLRDMAALVMAVAYFACVYLGKSIKLKILVRHIEQAARRIYGIPEFRF